MMFEDSLNKNMINSLRGSTFAMLHDSIYRQLTVNLYKSITSSWGEDKRSLVLTATYQPALASVPTRLVQKYMTDSLLLFKDAC
jgi:hypothetical protein